MGKRKAGNRRNKSSQFDSRKHIVIATEGSQTEPKYFDALRQKYRSGSVKVLRKGTKSDPMSVLNRLDSERKRRNEKTEFWAVIDHDRRPKEELETFAKRAKEKGYCIADSNPCFELWLLLHFKALTEISGLVGNAEVRGCGPIETALGQFDDSFSKSRYNAAKYITRLENAISNAKANEALRVISSSAVSTRVFELVESIINSSTSPNNPLH